MNIQTTYRANGKLLLTAEYLVLRGAKAIALPLKFGQRMSVYEKTATETISWKAYFDQKLWFTCELNPIDFSIVSASDAGKAETLQKLFQAIKRLNPDFHPESGTCVETVLESNPEWGFGSSSTLVSLLSQWAKVNPFRLNELIFKGSGFDIACANADGPIFYVRNEEDQAVTLNYPFADQLFLGYSGRKMKTINEVTHFLNTRVSNADVLEMSSLSQEFAVCIDQHEFNRLIRQHEKLVGSIIRKTPAKQEYFADFEGEIKSLGAWGGDFYLISTRLPFQELVKYFEPKGVTPVLMWNKLILTRK